MEKLRAASHEKVNDFRSVNSVINTRKFERLWSDSTPEGQDACRKIVEGGNREGLQKWMDNHPSIEIGEMPATHLKMLARRYKISNYSRLDRLGLIEALVHYEETR